MSTLDMSEAEWKALFENRRQIQRALSTSTPRSSASTPIPVPAIVLVDLSKHSPDSLWAYLRQLPPHTLFRIIHS